MTKPPAKRDGRGQPLALPGPIGELAKEMNGKDNLAKEMGVDVKTVYRFAHDGRVSSLAAKLLIERLFRRFKIMEGVEEFLAASGPKTRGKLKLGEPKTGDS